MRRADHQMARLIDESRLFLRIGSPENEDDGMLLIVDRADDRIGELLPALALMRCRHRPLHRQHAVEQQDTLPRPVFKKAVAGRRDAQIVLQLFINIDQRRWRTHAWLDAERQPMRLPLAMIRVLTEDDDPYLVERRQIQSAKILRPLGKNLLAATFFLHQEFFQCGHIGAGKFRSQSCFPALLDLHSRFHRSLALFIPFNLASPNLTSRRR
jgi:hypothetical protein